MLLVVNGTMKEQKGTYLLCPGALATRVVVEHVKRT
jgi:hypothetical protein